MTTVFDPPAQAPAPAPVPRRSPEEDQPRKRPSQAGKIAADTALAGATGVASALILRLVLDWSGVLSTAIWAVVITLAASWLMSREALGQIRASDRMATVLVWLAGAVTVGALVWMVAFVAVKGWARLDLAFFTHDMAKVGPLDPGGGALHAIIGTLEEVGIATVVSVPIAVLTAVYLNEIQGRLAPMIRFIVGAMSGLPSIVAGLLVFTLWVASHGYSGIAASAALSVLMLPTITRTAEEILRTVPGNLREAALALGAREWKTVMDVVLPTARAGLITASILGVARAVGETAPVFLTALGGKAVNTNPLKGPQSDLPLFVYSLVRTGNAVQIQRAWTGALILVLLVLVLFVAARVVGARGSKTLRRS